MTQADESRLSFWSNIVIFGASLLWTVPGINVLLSVPAVAGLILIISRLGYFRAVVTSMTSLLIVAMVGLMIEGYFMALMSAAVFTVLVIAPGLTMGIASRNFLSAGKTVWCGFIPILIVMAITLFFYSDIARGVPDIVRQFNSDLSSVIDNSPGLSGIVDKQYGAGGDSRERFIEEFDKILLLFLRILPGTIIVTFLGILVLSLAVAGSIASRLGLMIPRFRPFYLWRANEWWLLPTAIGLILIIFAGDDFWRYFGGNILIVTGNIYAVAGFAVIEAYLKRLSAPVALKVISYLTMFLLMAISSVMLAVIGLADSRFNFRRENLDREEKNME